jgi:DNA invertase Pin-like site-specific DNA recombinase
VKVGYARVSSDEQRADLQIAALEAHGCATIYKDEDLSGATRARPALQQCLAALEKDDTLVVWKLDRLARSLRDTIFMLDDLRDRGVKFISVTEAIDTTTPSGRANWQMIGVFAELERSMIIQRTRAGLDAAKERGVRLGRPFKMTDDQVACAKVLLENGKPPSMVAEEYGVSRSTLYLHLSRIARRETARPRRRTISRSPKRS